MLKRVFGMSDKGLKSTMHRSDEDQRILDAYAAYEDIRRDSRTDYDVNYFLRRIEAARALLMMIPEGKFSDIRREVTKLTAGEYEELGLWHSPKFPVHHGGNTEHQDNLRAIEDFSYAIEFRRLAGEEPNEIIFRWRCEHYLHQKMPDKAVDDATQAITLKETPEAYLLRAEAYSQKGNYVRAKADIIYAMRIAEMIQQKGGVFDVFGRICADVVADHRQNLEDLLRQYQAGKRDFRGIDLSWVDLSNVELPDIDLRGANLECSDLTGANFNKAILRSANLSNTFCYRRPQTPGYLVSFQDADLAGVNLDGAYLYKADLKGAQLPGAHLLEAVIMHSSLVGANFSDTILAHTDFSHSDLTGTSFVNADFTNADLTDALIDERELMKAMRLENVRGLSEGVDQRWWKNQRRTL